MGIWFAFAAGMILFVAIPTRQRRLVSVFSLQRSRWTALATVPAMLLSGGLTFLVALAAVVAVAVYIPETMELVAWIGLAVFMLHALWAMQDRRSRMPIADNDNLPERRIDRIFLHVLLSGAPSARHGFALAGLLAQFVDPRIGLAGGIRMLAIFLACLAVSGLVSALFPRLAFRRARRSIARQATGKPRTVFIARRAVTAGFRRIAA